MSLDTLKVNRPDHAVLPEQAGHADPLSRLFAPAGLLLGVDRPDAVLFDLDGVLVDTAEFHYLAWSRLADELGLPFDRQANEAFRGVCRADCLTKLLGRHNDVFAAEEKVMLGERKNDYYKALIATLSPESLAPGARMLLGRLREADIPAAVVSASRNAREVLSRLGIVDAFRSIVDGTMVERSKPDPQGFLLAAGMVHATPSRCVVIEDAEAGVKAALAGGMKAIALAPRTSAAAVTAHASAPSLADLSLDMLKVLR